MRAKLRGGLYVVQGDFADLPSSVSVAAVKIEPTIKLEPQSKPFTYTENRAQIQGKHGYVLPGTTGRNPLDTAHLRTDHASKRRILDVLKHNAADGLGTTYEA